MKINAILELAMFNRILLRTYCRRGMGSGTTQKRQQQAEKEYMRQMPCTTETVILFMAEEMSNVHK